MNSCKLRTLVFIFICFRQRDISKHIAKQDLVQTIDKHLFMNMNSLLKMKEARNIATLIEINAASKGRKLDLHLNVSDTPIS